jgi:uncharacterized phage protein gp47/JayE
MQPSLKTFSQYVSDMSAAVQGAASQALDLSVGSVSRALLEANASVALWLQALITDVLAASRAATAQADDLDVWMSDFSFGRLPASHATGRVTFLRYTASGVGMIPVDTRVRTTDGSVSFVVVREELHPLWSQALAGYLLPAATELTEVPIRAEFPGVAGNVLPDSITLIASSISGIDLVTNPQATSGGTNQESDAAFRSRFTLFLNSQSRATLDAVRYAIVSTRQGLTYAIYENEDSSGTSRHGHFVIVVDDGTGHPSDEDLEAISTAVHRVRPVGTTFSVHVPVLQPVDVTLSVTLDLMSASAANELRTTVSTAISSFINSLPIGASLSVTRIAQVAYSTSPFVRNVGDVQINGSPTDYSVGPRCGVKTNSIAVA